MKVKNIVCTIVLSFIFSLGFSQKRKVRKANREYKNLAYIKTSDILLEVVNNGYKSNDVLQKLANSYYFNNEMESASTWYGALMAFDENQDSEYYFRYALVLRSIGNYEASDVWMQKFLESRPNDLRGKAFLSEGDYKARIEDLSRDDLKLLNLSINTPASDFGTTEYDGKILFASARAGGKTHHWNDQPFLDLFSAEKISDTIFDSVTALKGNINTEYHESSPVFTPDGNYMFFTRNNFYNNKYRKDKRGINRLKLYRAEKDTQGTWSIIHSVHFNSDAYSVAHPTISKDGKKLYFASDMPGTIGLSDIFVVDINEDGTLGKPEGLGDSLNTEGQETFPFVNSNGDLYFSSNGLPGLGALDIFVSKDLDSKLRSGKSIFDIQNMGRPVNSKADDFGFYENLVSKQVFFSSNREGGKGSDDIYAYINTKCKQKMSVSVTDSRFNMPLETSKIKILDKNGNELETKTTQSGGILEFILPCGEEFIIRAENEDYISDEKRIDTLNSQKSLKINFSLARNIQTVGACDDLSKVLNIPMIYFDFNESNIRYDAEVDLQKILVVLNNYPTMYIDIRSHTDCRGSATYNKQLSDRRAKATMQYLIDKGIDAKRLTAKGYGESILINDCGCNTSKRSDCPEETHQKNRRSEFIIVGIDGKTCNNN